MLNKNKNVKVQYKYFNNTFGMPFGNQKLRTSLQQNSRSEESKITKIFKNLTYLKMSLKKI